MNPVDGLDYSVPVCPFCGEKHISSVCGEKGFSKLGSIELDEEEED